MYITSHTTVYPPLVLLISSSVLIFGVSPFPGFLRLDSGVLTGLITTLLTVDDASRIAKGRMYSYISTP